MKNILLLQNGDSSLFITLQKYEGVGTSTCGRYKLTIEKGDDATQFERYTIESVAISWAISIWNAANDYKVPISSDYPIPSLD